MAWNKHDAARDAETTRSHNQKQADNAAKEKAQQGRKEAADLMRKEGDRQRGK